MASNKKRIIKFKCPYCEERYERADLVAHVGEVHEDYIPEGYTPLRVVFDYINKKPANYNGKCTECGGPTGWDENKGRYNRQCSNPKCRESYIKKFEKNMKDKLGVTRISSTPEGQEKMLANRKISGKYKFQDGGERTYTGKYEKATLEFLDKVMNCSSADVITPGPVIEYTYKKQKHFYISDIYYQPYNLVIEVKDGGDNPNNRDMKEYREKQIEKEKAIIKNTDYNYIRLTNNDLSQLMSVFAELKMELVDNTNDRVIDINESLTGNDTAEKITAALVNSLPKYLLYKITYNGESYIPSWNAIPKDKLDPEKASVSFKYKKIETFFTLDGCKKVLSTLPSKIDKKDLIIKKFRRDKFDKIGHQIFGNKYQIAFGILDDINESVKITKSTKVYYGLTEEESKKKKLVYNKTNGYTHKGVNISLNGLKKFISDNNMQDLITKYTILSISNFDVDESVDIDEEYDMIAVNIPFEIPITNVHNLDINDSISEAMNALLSGSMPGINDTQSVYIVNYLQNNVFSGHEEMNYAISDNIGLTNLICRDREGVLRKAPRGFLENCKYTVYKVPNTTVEEVSKKIAPYMDQFVSYEFLYEAVTGKKMYEDAQILYDPELKECVTPKEYIGMKCEILENLLSDSVDETSPVNIHSMITENSNGVSILSTILSNNSFSLSTDNNYPAMIIERQKDKHTDNIDSLRYVFDSIVKGGN